MVVISSETLLCVVGFFQRLEKMAKQAFGSVILFGSDNNSTISGVWIWRGHDLAFNVSAYSNYCTRIFFS